MKEGLKGGTQNKEGKRIKRNSRVLREVKRRRKKNVEGRRRRENSKV